MKTLTNIRESLGEGRIELTAHALKRMVERNISKREIMETSTNLELIEDYADDKYYPSCLLLGYTAHGRPLHLHASRLSGENVRLITVYEPNPEEWVDNFRRRKY
ncbi:MAG: DUF4258 domain-containing protein [Candidatus Kapaibacterium sp.]